MIKSLFFRYVLVCVYASATKTAKTAKKLAVFAKLLKNDKFLFSSLF